MRLGRYRQIAKQGCSYSRLKKRQLHEPVASGASVAALNLRNDQRVGAIGRTGCGKTFGMHRVLHAFRLVLVVDSKHRVDWKGYYLTYDPMAAMAAIAKKRRVIYRPNGEIPSWFWTRAMDVLHEGGGGVVYVDEMPEVCSANFMPSGLKTLFRLGRELGVGVYWSGQEATGVHNTALRQSDVLLLFLNQGASDREKLIKTCGDMGEAAGHLHMTEFTVYEGSGEAYDAQNIPVYKFATDAPGATG